jgi:hypothetical protein
VLVARPVGVMPGPTNGATYDSAHYSPYADAATCCSCQGHPFLQLPLTQHHPWDHHLVHHCSQHLDGDL